MIARSWIVLVSPSYGGAEKRFFDVFTALRRAGMDLGVVAPCSLVRQFKADHPERADLFDRIVEVATGPWSRWRFLLRWRRLLRTWPRGLSYHYPLNCLWMLHLRRGDRVTMSVADCSSVPSPWTRKRTDAWAWLAFAFVRRIDVLSPAVLEAMRAYRARSRMSLTPGGTFVIAPPAGDESVRRPYVAWLGRLVQLKGIHDLLDTLPALWQRLQGRVPDGTTFVFAGYGELEPQVRARLAALSTAGVPVLWQGYADAAAFLPTCTVLLSMQETTNFPSRVVAEALMAGCAVIVRDTGDSRLFGDPAGLEYCPRVLDPEDLAPRLERLLARGPAEARAAREAAIARFSDVSYLAYFRCLIEGSAP